MSHYDFETSKQIVLEDFPFYALIMAAMRQADTSNQRRLQAMWPDVWDELRVRYHAPGGYLPTEVPAVVDAHEQGRADA